ncbi:protein GRAVITROPIC IN THE LIGHT 1 [Magnolia sinica]|uniref:protein GRAVITROPIC IN THE LIGHT 1 n=1 Tax=Magnolia sinica TaxID=86752 RepID=UPI002657ED91|nr:protein GRAVITROPIC IN THE LIGHT 1 [Magnolia sinica]
MATKVPNLSDLIHRVASSCLLHPVGRVHGPDGGNPEGSKEEEEKQEREKVEGEGEEDFRVWEEEEEQREGVLERMREVEGLLEEVFEGVSAMKRAYVSLQEAHCPWDPEKMRVADVAVVAELRRLGRLRERFRRGGGGGGNGGRGLGPYREAVVGPYEAAVEELKREVRVKEAEVEGLKEKLRTVATVGKKGRFHPSHRRVSCSSQAAASVPTPELFNSCMSQVKQACKTFISLLLSRMRSSNWDIEAAARTIQAPSDTIPAVQSPHHAKHAIESYVLCKFFQGFENETFYIDGSLSSLLHPSQFRQDCLSQFNGIKPMDPTELLGIFPNSPFGRFCCKKYLAVFHPQMEESLFGGLEQRRAVLAGNHPRTEFYAEFLNLAKAVWLLHLVAFALDPAPSHFQASRGADYHPEYMESVVRFSGGKVAPVGDMAVGFPVSPGFKLGNGAVIKSRVYLVSRV